MVISLTVADMILDILAFESEDLGKNWDGLSAIWYFSFLLSRFHNKKFYIDNERMWLHYSTHWIQFQIPKWWQSFIANGTTKR